MFGTVKELLGGVPPSGRDGVVVTLEPRSKYELPPAAAKIWRSIMERQDVIDALHAAKASAEKQIEEANQKLAVEERRISEDRQRWALMSGALGFREDQEGEKP